MKKAHDAGSVEQPRAGIAHARTEDLAVFQDQDDSRGLPDERQSSIEIL
jgi:hypothetical protein